MTETNSVKAHTATKHSKTIGKINNYINEVYRKTREEVIQQISKNTTREYEETRNLVSGELGRLRIKDNKEHVKTRAATLSAAIQEKFLKSLNFQGRDQRFNNAKEAHYKTFQWLFNEMDEEDSRSSSMQDNESEESDNSSSYQSSNSDGSEELDFVYEDLVEEYQGKVMSSFSD
ncbi:hypothetical protein L207DRAFT_538882 [Hyaloscypha variabilis F]|uniref:Uncharacterized protein n=1 Tax=Hyaloscypha variabilis (strain UAMH 11265 / GT02V1 / F) TaxID=1149755 RepID=A0A2J6QT75_HYAVF|nr:hypothetical protein L207DRAFT_538882 [Hyaloscypha variabilis F]